MYIPRKTVRVVLPEERIKPETKENLQNLDTNIVEKCGNLVTRVDIEEFIVENIHFGD